MAEPRRKGTRRSSASGARTRKAAAPTEPAPEEPAPQPVAVAPSAPAAPRWPPVSYWMKAAAGVIVVLALTQMVIALRQIIILILISVILAIGFQPAVLWLQRRGLSRGGAVAAIFLAGFTVLAAFLAMVVPTVIREISGLVAKGPDYLARAQQESGFIGDLNARFHLTEKLQSLQKDLPSTGLSLIKSFTSFLFNALTVLILTLYFTTAMPAMQRGIARLLRRASREEFESILHESTVLVGGYILGNMLVSVIAGVVSFIGLLIIGVPYAAALAFWVALADLVPTVGAILGASIAVLVAAFAGVPELVATIIFFLVYQQVENYVISPRVMGKTVQMSAAAVIIAVLVGGTLAGFAGALLALPGAAIIKVVVRELYLEERLEEVALADGVEVPAESPPG